MPGAEELFTGAFKALIGLGGGGWIVSGLFLLGIVYLYRENNRIRDRAEAVNERTVLALERVGTSTQTMATTLDGSTRSREELMRLVVELTRRVESDGTRSNEEMGQILKAQRDAVEAIRANEKDTVRIFAEHKDMLDLLRGNYNELIRISGRGSSFPQTGS